MSKEKDSMTAFSYSLGGENGNRLFVEGPGAGLEVVGGDLINGPLSHWMHWVSYDGGPNMLIASLKDTTMAKTVAAEIERLAAQYDS
jgi:hypothetical protein